MWGFPENEARRLQRAVTFDDAAELYDRARRGYPEQLYDRLFELAGIPPLNAEVLEIGCATGQASVPLAQRGCRLTCVEMGGSLARIAATKLSAFPNATVINIRFEDYNPGRAFDMVFSKDAWHWFDPKLKYAKAASLLRPGGVLAMSMSSHAFPPDYDRFFEEIQTTYLAIGEARIKFPPTLPEAMPDLHAEIEASGYFEDVRTLRHLWSREFTADEHIDLMSTASDHRLMPVEKRERLFADMRRLIDARPGGRIRKHQLTILHVARKRG